MKCPKCNAEMELIDDEHAAWNAYICKKCKIIVLELKVGWSET